MSDSQPIAPDLLELLACPDTHQPLRLASADELAGVNQKISSGDCSSVGGAKVEGALEAGLVREDGKLLYPIRDSIPVLLVDEGIAL